MNFEMSLAKWPPFCIGINGLTSWWIEAIYWSICPSRKYVLEPKFSRVFAGDDNRFILGSYFCNQFIEERLLSFMGRWYCYFKVLKHCYGSIQRFVPKANPNTISQYTSRVRHRSGYETICMLMWSLAWQIQQTKQIEHLSVVTLSAKPTDVWVK